MRLTYFENMDTILTLVLQRSDGRYQSPWHPILPQYPPTRYLKGHNQLANSHDSSGSLAGVKSSSTVLWPRQSPHCNSWIWGLTISQSISALWQRLSQGGWPVWYPYNWSTLSVHRHCPRPPMRHCRGMSTTTAQPCEVTSNTKDHSISQLIRLCPRQNIWR